MDFRKASPEKIRAFNITTYSGKNLTYAARSAVRGKGRYRGWEIRMRGEGTEDTCILVAFYESDGEIWETYIAI